MKGAFLLELLVVARLRPSGIKQLYKKPNPCIVYSRNYNILRRHSGMYRRVPKLRYTFSVS